MFKRTVAVTLDLPLSQGRYELLASILESVVYLPAVMFSVPHGGNLGVGVGLLQCCALPPCTRGGQLLYPLERGSTWGMNLHCHTLGGWGGKTNPQRTDPFAWGEGCAFF